MCHSGNIWKLLDQMKISRPAALWSTWEFFDWSNGLEYTQLHDSNFKYVFTLHKTSQYYQYT